VAFGGCCGDVTVRPARTEPSHRLQFGAGPADQKGMNTMACRAVAQAALSATTASLDDEAAWPLLLVAGWLTTATDLMLQAALLDEVLTG
jgi:hypothetical protein